MMASVAGVVADSEVGEVVIGPVLVDVMKDPAIVLGRRPPRFNGLTAPIAGMGKRAMCCLEHGSVSGDLLGGHMVNLTIFDSGDVAPLVHDSA
jgi:hypothetical protein